jgi:hypothetical protein
VADSLVSLDGLNDLFDLGLSEEKLLSLRDFFYNLVGRIPGK